MGVYSCGPKPAIIHQDVEFICPWASNGAPKGKIFRCYSIKRPGLRKKRKKSQTNDIDQIAARNCLASCGQQQMRHFNGNFSDFKVLKESLILTFSAFKIPDFQGLLQIRSRPVGGETPSTRSKVHCCRWQVSVG